MQRFIAAASTRVRVFAIGLAMAATGCGGISHQDGAADTEASLARAQAYANRLISHPSEERSSSDVIALGYLERGRLGLGSPFRLIDFALRDPGLEPEDRDLLGYALLAQVMQGRGYQIDDAVLGVVQLSGIAPGADAAEPQLQLIERTIQSAPTAAAGERAVRLGYRLAAAERSVEGVSPSAVAHVAALVADRRRAREDAQRLLRAAAARGTSPLTLLVDWRRELLFRVEAPTLVVASLREEEVEAREGVQVALALRAMAQRLSAPRSLVDAAAGRPTTESRSYLDPDAAGRLLELAEQRAYPAQAPIAVSVAINRDGFLTRPGLTRRQRAARRRFVESAWNEERFIAGTRLLRSEGAAAGHRLQLMEIQAAIFLRGWNQEEPWFPGDPAPTSRDLEARFGLASIEFDGDVEESWRPYYLRMLGRGLSDLHRVLPTASLRGLNIHIGSLPPDVTALALHEPGTRTLHLPPMSGAGTLAHEIGHDLDWQLARRRYGMRGGYATDLAVRANRRDRIASAMMGLSASLMRSGTDSTATAHETRPAEVFARGLDWFVAASLAREGRMGGYLTSFQDPVLTGYGTTRGPEVGGAAVPALFTILDPIAPVVERTRDWAVKSYGPGRTAAPAEIARSIATAGQELAPDRRFLAIRRAYERGLSNVNASSCRLGSGQAVRRLVATQRVLLRTAAQSAARGAAIDAVRALARERFGSAIRPQVDAWLAWRVYGGLEPIETSLEELIPSFEDILYQAAAVATDPSPDVAGPFDLTDTSPLCAGAAFATLVAEQRFVPVPIASRDERP